MPTKANQTSPPRNQPSSLVSEILRLLFEPGNIRVHSPQKQNDSVNACSNVNVQDRIKQYLAAIPKSTEGNPANVDKEAPVKTAANQVHPTLSLNTSIANSTRPAQQPGSIFSPDDENMLAVNSNNNTSIIQPLNALCSSLNKSALDNLLQTILGFLENPRAQETSFTIPNLPSVTLNKQANNTIIFSITDNLLRNQTQFIFETNTFVTLLQEITQLTNRWLGDGTEAGAEPTEEQRTTEQVSEQEPHATPLDSRVASVDNATDNSPNWDQITIRLANLILGSQRNSSAPMNKANASTAFLNRFFQEEAGTDTTTAQPPTPNSASKDFFGLLVRRWQFINKRMDQQQINNETDQKTAAEITQPSDNSTEQNTNSDTQLQTEIHAFENCLRRYEQNAQTKDGTDEQNQTTYSQLIQNFNEVFPEGENPDIKNANTPWNILKNEIAKRIMLQITNLSSDVYFGSGNKISTASQNKIERLNRLLDTLKYIKQSQDNNQKEQLNKLIEFINNNFYSPDNQRINSTDMATITRRRHDLRIIRRDQGTTIDNAEQILITLQSKNVSSSYETPAFPITEGKYGFSLRGAIGSRIIEFSDTGLLSFLPPLLNTDNENITVEGMPSTTIEHAKTNLIKNLTINMRAFINLRDLNFSQNNRLKEKLKDSLNNIRDYIKWLSLIYNRLEFIRRTRENDDAINNKLQALSSCLTECINIQSQAEALLATSGENTNKNQYCFHIGAHAPANIDGPLTLARDDCFREWKPESNNSIFHITNNKHRYADITATVISNNSNNSNNSDNSLYIGIKEIGDPEATKRSMFLAAFNLIISSKPYSTITIYGNDPELNKQFARMVMGVFMSLTGRSASELSACVNLLGVRFNWANNRDWFFCRTDGAFASKYRGEFEEQFANTPIFTQQLQEEQEALFEKFENLRNLFGRLPEQKVTRVMISAIA